MGSTKLGTIRVRLASLVAFGLWVMALLAIFSLPETRAAADLFNDKVAPIFQANCVFCHGGKIQRSGLDLRSLEAVLRGGAHGKAVVAGKPEESLLYKLITHAQEPKMPQGMDKLSDAEIAVIAEWIRTLAPAAAPAESGAPIRAAGYSITDKDRQFWSFRKPLRPGSPGGEETFMGAQ
jgi:cytochrome c